MSCQVVWQNPSCNNHALSNGQFLARLLLAGNATEKMVMSAYELNNFIFILARVPQIWSNYKVSAHGAVSHLEKEILQILASLIRHESRRHLCLLAQYSWRDAS